MTTTISDLPEDVLAKIFSKVLLTSLKPMRLTCKKWNALSKTHIIGRARKQLVALMDFSICSMIFDLQEICNDFVHSSVKMISVFNQVKISTVFHYKGLLLCSTNGLLLCSTRDGSKLLVWNPYLGQTRWIQPKNNTDRSLNCYKQNSFNRDDMFALGYDKNNHTHKILRILNDWYNPISFEIYDLRSNSWKVLDVNPDCYIDRYPKMLSLKGKTFFFARNKEKYLQKAGEVGHFLLCFDFTAERFGPRLPLPLRCDASFGSCIRDEQLAVLYQRNDKNSCKVIDMEIWVTNKIEPNELSWSKFWKMDVKPFAGFPYGFTAKSFFIDEEEKAALIFGNRQTKNYRHLAYSVGTNGYFKSMNIEDAPVHLVISSYIPSLVQL